MRAHKIATATMLVLTVSGWGVAGTGTAYAETGPGHEGKAKAAGKGFAHGGRAKARAQGGSATVGGELFQQNVAQSARQNNNCNNTNAEDETISLTDSRATGRCVTADGSLTAFSRVHNGPADAEGGSATASLVQQNTAQRGRQNNNCNNANSADISNAGRLEGRCTDQDLSITEHAHIKSGGARVDGGSTTGGDVIQQNTAQEGRQNNNCNNLNDVSLLDVEEGSRVGLGCGNKDHSFSKHTHIKSGGARAEGGSTTGADVISHNTAQEGRQNNNCNNTTDFDNLEVEVGSRERAGCGNRDHSFSKNTHIKGSGARVEGGSTTGADVNQQNTAQEGRQNNNCNNLNIADIDPTDGGRVRVQCGNKDHSFSKNTHIKSGGAHTQGGSNAASVEQQNTAQEGRQNNNCNNLNGDDTELDVTGGQLVARCENKDHSFNKHTHIKSGGAQTQGGFSTGGDAFQQNVAQEGRQNNTCNNFNNTPVDVEEGARSKSSCKTVDHSTNLHITDIGGGAKTTGGAASADLFQQNTAQEGRQNNNCNNTNNLELTLTGSRTQNRCSAIDRSTNIATINR
ncbi:hypothetical protein [Streptomyces sp. NPDC051776]|uniref:hypothetical protein n=1 Tax=Streptomyces sp. NPDC051776 TaxID=3155414 RepID=UPI00343E530B